MSEQTRWFRCLGCGTVDIASGKDAHPAYLCCDEYEKHAALGWEPVVVLPQAEAARLQALERAVRDEALRVKIVRDCTDADAYRTVAHIVTEAYRAALLARMEGK